MNETECSPVARNQLLALERFQVAANEQAGLVREQRHERIFVKSPSDHGRATQEIARAEPIQPHCDEAL